MLPIALSEVLGISLSEVMKKYFKKARSTDEVATRISEDLDRRIANGEDEIWLDNECRRVEERMDCEHQGQGVDDIF
jgi:hypothetical protein